jgi:hypothetical protein
MLLVIHGCGRAARHDARLPGPGNLLRQGSAGLLSEDEPNAFDVGAVDGVQSSTSVGLGHLLVPYFDEAPMKLRSGGVGKPTVSLGAHARRNRGGSVRDPTDPVGLLLLNVLAMVAEFESDLIRARAKAFRWPKPSDGYAENNPNSPRAGKPTRSTADTY